MNFSRLLIWVAFFALSQSAFAGLEAPTPKEWNQKMQNLYSALTALLVDVTSDERFKDPQNAKKIDQEMKDLGSLAHLLKRKESRDPTLLIFSENLSTNIEQAATAFRSGHHEYARSMIKQITGSCFSCHSRNDSGPQFGQLPFDASKIGFKPLELAQFYAATRQFDTAFNQFIKVINNNSTSVVDPWPVQEAVREALTLAVRVKRDPLAAETVVKEVTSNKSLPRFLKQDAESWTRSIEEWKLEVAKLKNKPARSTTEGALLTQAKTLMERAHKGQKYPLDRSADVIYLRASAVLHDLLQKFPAGKYTADALLLLGSSYEVIDLSPQDYLNKSFYEACINKAPHLPVARECYRRYEQATFFGFSGSSGLHLPGDVKDTLLRLWALAMPIDGGGVPDAPDLHDH